MSSAYSLERPRTYLDHARWYGIAAGVALAAATFFGSLRLGLEGYLAWVVADPVWTAKALGGWVAVAVLYAAWIRPPALTTPEQYDRAIAGFRRDAARHWRQENDVWAPLKLCARFGLYASIATNAFILPVAHFVGGVPISEAVSRALAVWWVFAGPLLAGIVIGAIWTAVRATRPLQKRSPAFLIGLRFVQGLLIVAVAVWYVSERFLACWPSVPCN